ncbi:hypothetical protein MKJ04_05240 [Pontibacter sp. E15-1]|uniref:hypothetical protein n=1 Tax=Pontibacter sp. E15-1 TaxID=2919918 RepID=UPI001F4F6DDC|nr:hypothetical protein [Pontibacter sp. E15-1]MCJ8164238.1 hypothetical protein [Pontibacter sp. E15-1]
MKKIAFISGAVSVSLTTLSILFKLLHLQGADGLLQLGMGLFAIVFVPSLAKYLYDKSA